MSYSDQPPDVPGAPPPPPEPPPGFAPNASVPPTFTLTPWIKRVGAYVIDWVPVFVISFIGIAFGKASIIFDLLAIAFWVWNRCYRAGTTGQSIGKTALNVKLIREADAQVVGPGLAFGRDICHVLDYAPWFIPFVYIGFYFPLWDIKRQTFADKICKTVVVDL